MFITKMLVLIFIITCSKVTANIKVRKEVNENASELKIKELEEKLEKQIEINVRHETMINSIKQRLESLSLRLNVCEKKRERVQFKSDNLTANPTSRNGNSSEYQHVQYGLRQGRQLAHNVAFSAYLDRRLTNLGPDHIIQFGGLNLNEGNAYNIYTGVFTAPYSGVYLFTFAAEDYAQHRVWLKLVVNGSLRSSIKIYPYPTNYNAMGSNTAILRLTAGYSVWIAVDSNDYGESLDGSTTLRTTTFSGVFLYQ